MTQNLVNLRGEGSITGLVEKVTTIKGEFKQQDCKLYLCIYSLSYFMVMTKKKYEILRVLVVLPDVREPI